MHKLTSAQHSYVHKAGGNNSIFESFFKVTSRAGEKKAMLTATMKITPRVTVNVIISATRLHSADTLSGNLWHLRDAAAPSGRWGLIARYGDARWGRQQQKQQTDERRDGGFHSWDQTLAGRTALPKLPRVGKLFFFFFPFSRETFCLEVNRNPQPAEDVFCLLVFVCLFI